MGIHIALLKEESGKEVFGPVITCDYCMEVIDNHRQGAYVWGTELKSNNEVWRYPVRFYHKQTGPNRQKDSHAACRQAWDDYEAELESSGRFPMWGELVLFPFFLSNNLEISEEDLQQAIEHHSMFG